jgi:UDP-N-acetylglucosamine 2-epimerase (non-hydrolysing)
MSERKRIALIVGARPQFIKIALLVHELNKKGRAILIHTGQHYDYEMSASFFEQAGIPAPDHNLAVGSGTHGAQTGDMLKGLESLFMEEQPDLVVVVGDTNSTLAGALAATKLHIPIAHIEAGMRNFDRKKPEEINRIITDHITDYFFAPAANAVQNLKDEGIDRNTYIVGDISNDLFVANIDKAEQESKILESLAIVDEDYIVLTIHKSINTDSKANLEAILRAVNQLDIKVVFPAHPRTTKCIQAYGLESLITADHIVMSKPLSYFDMIRLMKNAKKILTDSGGIQKEALALRLPCITMRKTEWVETLEGEWNVEADIHNQEAFLELINNHKPTGEASNFLGQGDTYQKISNLIWSEILS